MCVACPTRRAKARPRMWVRKWACGDSPLGIDSGLKDVLVESDSMSRRVCGIICGWETMQLW